MLLRLLLIVISIFFVFDKLTRNYADSDDFTLDWYGGKKRSGKTTILTAKAIQYQLKNRKVYTNFDVPGCYTFNPNIIGTKVHMEPYSVIILDEIGIVFNNRDWENFDKDKIEWFKLQGHYKVKVIIASQSPTDFDKVLRDLTDNIYIVKKIARVFVIARPVGKSLDIGNADSGSNMGGQIIFKYFYKFQLPKIYFIPRYAPFFDSFSKPEAGRSVPAFYNDITETQQDLRTIKGAIKVYFSIAWVKTKEFIKRSLEWLKTIPKRLRR